MTCRRVHGFTDGDRVRDRRDGATGTVRVLRVSEVRWDGSCVADELALAAPHLELMAERTPPVARSPLAHVVAVREAAAARGLGETRLVLDVRPGGNPAAWRALATLFAASAYVHMHVCAPTHGEPAGGASCRGS